MQEEIPKRRKQELSGNGKSANPVPEANLTELGNVDDIGEESVVPGELLEALDVHMLLQMYRLAPFADWGRENGNQTEQAAIGAPRKLAQD